MDDQILIVPEKAKNARDTVLMAVALDTQQWAQETQRDEEGKVHLAKARERTKGYTIFNGMLYFEDRLFVPRSQRKALLGAAHCDVPACHGGTRSTADRLKSH